MKAIIRDFQGEIVGRVNLVDIVKGNFNKAEIGYRIGEEYIGKGYAQKSVKLVLDDAVNKYKLHRVEAGVSPENIASQKVLINNGFRMVGAYKEYIFLNGKWSDSAIFEKVLD
ncbi:Ribosomal-protein-serine acetyltransferase [Clostridium tertium]|uniref:Ribosomal-protein-serine acetyltransferase n=2 Tax=Clostridium tertium TaxID=1559 RepID=A0A6N3ERR0_9CLOT